MFFPALSGISDLAWTSLTVGGVGCWENDIAEWSLVIISDMKSTGVWTTVHQREWRLVLRREFKDLYSFSACKVNCAELERSKNWCSNLGWMQRFSPNQSPFTTVQFYRPRLTAEILILYENISEFTNIYDESW